MLGTDIAAMTAIKVKNFSTSTFNRVARRFSKIDFFHRNRKTFVFCLAIWLGANIAGFFIYRSTISNAHDEFSQQGMSAVDELARDCKPFILDEDTLALNLEIRELENLKNLKFAAVLDHKNTILTQTGILIPNREFEPFKNKILIDKIDDIIITSEISADKTRAINFLKNITYGDVEIGKAYIALAANGLYQTLNQFRVIYLAGICLVTLGLAGVVFWLDRVGKAKALKVKQDFENMDRIGPYRLQDMVARGGMAELYLADYVREDGFRKKVAVKRILPHLAANPDFIKMFTREARLAALLQHPNVVQIFDYGKIKNAYFIAMEYIDGKNLGEILSTLNQGMTVDYAVFVIAEICKGLDYSHTKRDDKTREPLRIVHRDISPQNMLISYRGEVKISDFGISKARSEPNLTQAGVIKGKLAYLSPEQALGDAVDHRADIYALGLVFYETLAGKRVYQFDNDMEAIRAIPRMEIEPLSDLRPDVPEELNRILMKCLEKTKESRYQTASELNSDLTAFKKEHKMTFDASDLANFMKTCFKDNGKA
jgi:tRNA A-37 threonylcarbamoyl transferase component Bud32